MSVRTENNISIECIQFIDSEIISTSLNQFEQRKPDTNLLAVRKSHQIKSKHKQNQTKEFNYFNRSIIFIRRIKGLCSWKIPWIIILVSVVQVYILKSTVFHLKKLFLLSVPLDEFNKIYKSNTDSCLLRCLQRLGSTSNIQSEKKTRSLALFHISHRTFQFNTFATERYFAGKAFSFFKLKLFRIVHCQTVPIFT